MNRPHRSTRRLAGAAFLALLLGMTLFLHHGDDPHRLLDGWMPPAWASGSDEGPEPNPVPDPGECAAGIPRTNPDEIYTVNTDGTVTDSRTGLIWDRCAWGQSGDDCVSGAASSHTWAQALEVAATANANVYKGYADWRLPNTKESRSLVEGCRFDPAINDIVFPNTVSDVFWSSSPVAGGNPNVSWASTSWYVDFGSGAIGRDNKARAAHVRLVRSPGSD